MRRQAETARRRLPTLAFSGRAGETSARVALPSLQWEPVLRMRPIAKFVIAVAIALVGAPLGTSVAATAVCALPRALLCEGCASGIVVTLTRAGGCRIAFTPGTAAPAAEGVAPITFVYGAPSERGWTKRPRAASAPDVAGRGRCLVFNGNQYCE